METIDPGHLFSLEGRTALVTGAAGHLGRAMAGALAGAGAVVYLNGRRPGPLEDLRDELRSEGASAEIAPFDVLDPGAVTNFLARLAQQSDRLDVLVNNAHSGRTGTLESAEAKDYTDAFAVAVQAAAELTKAALELLKAAAVRQGHASVINITSMYGMVSPDPSIYGSSGQNSPPYYGAAKAGLIQLTRYAAVHLAPHKVRVNAISPGPFPPPALADRMPDFWALLNHKSPMRRVGRAAELQGAVLFLASDASTYVTGINLPVDGGWTAW